MGAGSPENGFWPAAVTADLRSANQSMNANTRSAENPADTTDAQTETKTLYIRENGALVPFDAVEVESNADDPRQYRTGFEGERARTLVTDGGEEARR